MGYMARRELEQLGFKHLGKDVKISEHANIYDPEHIEIGDYSRIDDFCVISGNVCISDYVHITPMCLIAGGKPGVIIGRFSTLSYGVKIFSQSDDYSGKSMCNSLIPREFKCEVFQATKIGCQVIIGAGATIVPGANIEDGCAIGAMSLVLQPTRPWGVYAGIPAKKIKDRDKRILKLEKKFLETQPNDSV